MAKYQTNKTKRAVYNTLRCIGVMLFGQNRFKQPKFLENAAQKDKYEVWLGMIDEGKINEVENELIEETEQRRPDMHPSESEKMAMLEVALQIYKYINDKDVSKEKYESKGASAGGDGDQSVAGAEFSF